MDGFIKLKLIRYQLRYLESQYMLNSIAISYNKYFSNTSKMVKMYNSYQTWTYRKFRTIIFIKYAAYQHVHGLMKDNLYFFLMFDL